MAVQKLRSYTYNDMPKLDYIFFYTPCIKERIANLEETEIQKLLEDKDLHNTKNKRSIAYKVIILKII